MKKLLLATVLSMAATAVYAEPTAMLKVQGTLTSAGSCLKSATAVWQISAKWVWIRFPPAWLTRPVIKM